MKKFIATLALVATLFSTSQFAFQKDANAFLLADAADGYLNWNGAEIVMCVLFLFVCLFDEENQSSGMGVSAQTLIDNGYDPAQIDNILRDQKALMEILKNRKQRVVVSKGETRESLARGFKQLLPSVSQDFVNFQAEYNGIR